TFCAYVSIVSQSDCYVSLWLPTASDEKFQTKTIKNCRDPVWNETFYFRIQRKVKLMLKVERYISGGHANKLCIFHLFFQNILEMTVSDDDIIRDDDHAIILFDVAKISLGKRVIMTFPLNPQVRMQSEV
ncbi:hypothetical protein ASZ78_002426, partial [Callipepla squamata]